VAEAEGAALPLLAQRPATAAGGGRRGLPATAAAPSEDGFKRGTIRRIRVHDFMVRLMLVLLGDRPQRVLQGSLVQP
jgi:hypothetical protein